MIADEEIKEKILDFIAKNGPKKATLNALNQFFQAKGKEKKRVQKILLSLRRSGTFSHKRRKKPTHYQGASVVGIFKRQGKGGYLKSCHRDYPIPLIFIENGESAEEGDVVIVELPARKISENLGPIHNPLVYEKIITRFFNLPTKFSKASLLTAKDFSVPDLGNRIDLRALPLVTIDGDDAKDFDDAVFAEHFDTGKWRIIVAIADVSYYVTPDSPLDKDAFERGNSVYFPAHVIPMLPEALSNNICSLKPGEDRACVFVDMIINDKGQIESYQFNLGLMRSKARLTYKQVQKAFEGEFDTVTEPLKDKVITPLWEAYQTFLAGREKRQPLELNIKERKVIFNKKGRPVSIGFEEQSASQKLIEEFMIAANVCAAKILSKLNYPAPFRIHDIPALERIENLKLVFKSLKLPRLKHVNKPSPAYFNKILKGIQGEQSLLSTLVLRCQAQALYSFKNTGHFGLNLTHYCHFTSPIRRYADLIVHRALISALRLREEKPIVQSEDLEKKAKHLCETERRAAKAEREAIDRYALFFLETVSDQSFDGIISGLSKAGLFVTIIEKGAEGFIPKRSLMDDIYVYDAPYHRFMGLKKKKSYQIGQKIRVKIESIDAEIGRLSLLMVP